jgi:rubrerythrin
MGQESPSSSFINDILGSIKGEATAVDFYGRLAEAAPSAEMKEDILSIRQDEHDHFQMYSQLYTQLTGTQPVFQITPVQFQSFSEGLRIAYRDELQDYEKYRNFYLMTHDQTLRDIFLRAFSDEIKHAIRFGFMTTNLA